MATMPIEILADAKHKSNNNKHNKYSEDNKEKLNKTNQNQIKTTTTTITTLPPVTKTNKTKTLLNWLKNSNNNNNSLKKFDKIKQEPSTVNNNSSTTTTTTNCTCPSSNLTHSTNSISFFRTLKSNKDDDTLREFRGVQTLRNFWNKRITANKETALRNKSSKQQQFTKSVSCLVNAINNTGEPPPGSTAISTDSELVVKVHKLRALSLHDCSRDSPDFDEISLSDIDIQKHLEKDNFYKYKTAEQASKLRELSEHSTQRKLSSGIVLTAGHKSERFDWLKRHEKLINKKILDSPNSSLTMPNTDNDNTQLIASAKIINVDSKMHTHLDDASAIPTPVGYGKTEVGNTASSATTTTTTTSTITETNSSQHTIGRRRPTTRQDSAKTLNSCSSSISRGSSDTSLANSSPANGHRALVKRNSSTRKYSFKTHTRSYHVPRKMHANKDNANTNAAGGVKPGNSLVAKLTQQFNEIIQKDKTLLEEIKRKNGVIMTHKGHVYKVVDTAALNRSQSPSVSRNTSKVKESAPVSTTIKRSTPSSTVQRNIKKFETESRDLKPKVPLKSVHVLKKSNELVLNKNQGNNNRVLSIKSVNNKKDLDVKTEQKPQTLALPSTLEIVKEEVKTPLETTEENKILTDCQQNCKENQNPYNTAEIKTAGNSREENILPVQDVLKENLKPNESVIYRTIKRSQGKDNDIPHKVTEEQAMPTKTSEEIKITQQLVTDRVDGEKNEEWQEKTEINDKEMKIKTSKSEETQQKTCLKDKIIDKEKVALGAEREVKEEADKQTQTLKPTSNLREEKECNAIQCSNTESPDSCVENLDAAEEVEVEVEEEEEKRKRKHKYAKIYEKLRFFTPFAHSNKKQKLNATGPPTTTDTSRDSTNITNTTTLAKNTNSSESLIEESTLKSGEDASIYADEAYSFIFNSEAKLLDALEQVDKKLQNLSQESEELKACSPTLESDEYGQSLKPNSSFLHATYEKETQQKATTATVIQAVNVSLVNNIEGEQMIMEQKEIQQQEKETKTKEETIKTPELPPRKIIQEEPLYEPICIGNKTLEPKTETSYENGELETTTDDLTYKRGHIIEEEDIYQTVEEVQNQNQTCEGVTNNSQNELDGYEPIENPDEILITLKSDTKISSTTFDGYEEYTPNVELANTTPNTTYTTTSPAVRKVTDELPDLPKPKRVLPKSPIPLRPAPKPPLPQRQSSAEEYRESTCQEPHYYGGEENIYDTIKSSHCYESLQSMSNKLHSSPSLLRHKNSSDCVSLTSNCYESISHFKRTNIVGHHSGGSSNGSTLTISSENKTNSLYEDSLNSSLHYASRRIYQLNVHATNGVLKSASADNSSINGMNGYGGSIGRTTDTSDEWTDVTDNESGDGESKPQFIM